MSSQVLYRAAQGAFQYTSLVAGAAANDTLMLLMDLWAKSCLSTAQTSLLRCSAYWQHAVAQTRLVSSSSSSKSAWHDVRQTYRQAITWTKIDTDRQTLAFSILPCLTRQPTNGDTDRLKDGHTDRDPDRHVDRHTDRGPPSFP